MNPQSQMVALLQVIETQQAELAAQREQATRDREEARREIVRLVRMVEKLTKQLDALLHERNEERRAELAKLREEAKAALKAPPNDETPKAPPPPPPSKPARRHAHGRGAIPPSVPRDTVALREDVSSHR